MFFFIQNITIKYILMLLSRSIKRYENLVNSCINQISHTNPNTSLGSNFHGEIKCFYNL